MLVVILGAGASFDSSPRFPPPPPGQASTGAFEPYRPPLTIDLFNQDRPQFEFIQRYGPAQALVRPIQRRLQSEPNLERILGEFEQQVEQYPVRRGQLLAMQFYLRDYLTDCSDHWWRIHSGVTTYAEFVDSINSYSHRKAEQVCLITFNYDTLLDRSLESQHIRDLSTTDGYIAPHGPWYVKVHGSVNWKRVTDRSSAGVLNPPADEVIRALGAPDLRPPSPEFVVDSDEWAWAPKGSLPNYLAPALAIPVEEKTEQNFEIPSKHLAMMKDALAHATRILIVGWRASENHFNEILRSHNQGLNVPFTLVCGEGRAGETIDNLKHLGFVNFQDMSSGFTGFVESGQLEEFLSS